MPFWARRPPGQSGQLMSALTGHRRRIDAVAIAPSGAWLATASRDETARIWSIEGTPRATLTGHKAAVTGVAIAPDGTWLATNSDDHTARIWGADGTPRATL